MTAISRTTIALTASCLAAVAPPTHAQLTITNDTAPPPTGDLLLSFDTDETGSRNFYPMSRGGDDEAAYGQTFVFDTDVVLDKISIKARITQDVSAVPLLLWFGTGYTGQTHSGISSLIVDEQAPLPEGLDRAGDIWYLTLDFEDQVLAAGQTYAFMPRFATGGSHPEMDIGFTGEYAYEGGAAFTFDAGFGYATVLNNEMVFFLHGRPLDCPADFDGDGVVDTRDMLAFLNAWNAHDAAADCNTDGATDTLDILCFLNLWVAGC